MAHFYAEIEGTRGATSRIGSKVSGIKGHIRGWNCGVRVRGKYKSSDEQDEFQIYATGGSSGRRSDTFIGTVDSEGNFHLAEDIRQQVENDVRKMIRDGNRPCSTKWQPTSFDQGDQ